MRAERGTPLKWIFIGRNMKISAWKYGIYGSSFDGNVHFVDEFPSNLIKFASFEYENDTIECGKREMEKGSICS